MSFTACLQWFSAPDHHKPMAHLPVRALECLKGAYNEPRITLKGLQFRIKRQIRSERRKSMLILLQTMLYYSDHETFKVGRYINGKWESLSLERLARYARMSYTRAKRAFNDLVKQAYISSELCWERKKGKIINLPSVKRLTMRLFKELNLYDQMDKLRLYKLDRRLKKEKKEEIKSSRVQMGILSEIMRPVAQPARRMARTALVIAKPKAVAPRVELTATEKQFVTKEALRLYELDKTKGLLEYGQRLKNEILARRGG